MKITTIAVLLVAVSLGMVFVANGEEADVYDRGTAWLDCECRNPGPPVEPLTYKGSIVIPHDNFSLDAARACRTVATKIEVVKEVCDADSSYKGTVYDFTPAEGAE